MTDRERFAGMGSGAELQFRTAAPPLRASLPRGRHGLPREFVDRNHRSRLLSGAIDALADRGYLATTVADITAHAAVSRSVFYRHFNGKQDCCLAAYDLALDLFSDELKKTLARIADWPQQVGAAVRTGLGMLAADPGLARLLAVEIYFAGDPAVARREAVSDLLAQHLRRGRQRFPAAVALPPLLEPALVGSAFSLIARSVTLRETERLVEFAPDLIELLLLPYLGKEEARQVARQPG